MILDENSSGEDILKYIKKDFIYFLFYYSDKPWAQPYIDEAANITVKERPYTFLINFSDKPWAQPYIDEAAKEAAKLDPEYFLEKWADKFPHHINTALFALVGKNETKWK